MAKSRKPSAEQCIYRYWVEIHAQPDGAVRRLPLNVLTRIHLPTRAGQDRLPDEQVLELQDGATLIRAKDLQELATELRRKYPDEGHDRFLRQERDREAEVRRADAIHQLAELVAKAAVRDLSRLPKRPDEAPATKTVAEFRGAIRRLRSDPAKTVPGVWYKTQKEHWLGWLKEYNTAGAYGRKPGTKRDARYAYNHIVEPKMLLWLIPAAGVAAPLVREARKAAKAQKSMMAQSAAIRRVVPWDVLDSALWLTT